jgi:hypothetical protein
VLVEGTSDQVAVETLAERRSVDLVAERVEIVPIGGAHAIGRFLAHFGPLGVPLAGLYDAAEEREFGRALGSDLGRADLEQLGFFVCEPDLEGELIRALGTSAVEAVADAHGDLNAFRTLQKQPAWRGQPVEEQQPQDPLRAAAGRGARSRGGARAARPRAEPRAQRRPRLSTSDTWPPAGSTLPGKRGDCETIRPRRNRVERRR